MDDGTRISEETEQFLRAARAREVPKVSAILDAKPSLVNTQEAGGYTALHFAAFNGDIDMIKLLMERKADIEATNYDENTPLVMAVKGHQLEAIRTLVGAGADVNRSLSNGCTAIHHAASMGFLDCVSLLAELGATTVHEDCEAGTILHWACHSGDLNVIGAMLYEFHLPVDVPDKYGGSALFTALFMQKEEAAQFLLDHGANPNVCITEDGSTPLHVAVEHSTAECVRLLCTYGGDATAKNKENVTPLELAEKASKSAMVRELSKAPLSKAQRSEEAAKYKNQGNKVFAQGENVKAAKFYSLAIRLENTNHVFFSNRAACYFNQRLYNQAYWDSVRCIALNAQWPKGYLRKATTELALKKYDEAAKTAAAGLALEPSNKDLTQVKDEALQHRKK